MVPRAAEADTSGERTARALDAEIVRLKQSLATLERARHTLEQENDRLRDALIDAGLWRPGL